MMIRRTTILIGLMLAMIGAASGQDSTSPVGEELRTLDSHFPFLFDVDQWASRAESLRFHIQMSLGLWPLPEKTPLNAVIHGSVDAGDYTVERVYFESFPGFYVTGSLYRPKSLAGKKPGILCPHGHYNNGRFTEFGEQEIARMIQAGEESIPENARSPLQARCARPGPNGLCRLSL